MKSRSPTANMPWPGRLLRLPVTIILMPRFRFLQSRDLKQLAPATVPEQPVRPKVVLNTILAGLLALVVLTTAALIVDGVRENALYLPVSIEEKTETTTGR